MIRWFTENGIAANFLMIGILVAGVHTALTRVPLEVSPASSWETVIIDMPYRGATAKDVERAILIPVEEALEGVPGVEHLHSDGYQGRAKFYVNALPGTNLRTLMDDVRARIDGITTFPRETETPRIYIPDSRNYYEVLRLSISGQMSEHDLRVLGRKVRDDLLELDGISNIRLVGPRDHEFSIEADADQLLSYNLSFQDLADAIQGFSIDLPAGSIESDSGTFVVRTKGQAYSEREFENIPVRSGDGATVLLGDVATVRDGFVEGEQTLEFDGAPAVFLEVNRTGNESALEVSRLVREYAANAKGRFPSGVQLTVWDDDSEAIRGRLRTLITSMIQGGLLVMIVLGLFLRPALAFWIVLGIPLGFAGGVLVMPWLGVTANIMSLFGFIIVLGIVVDDAIVTGESVYSKIQDGAPPLQAAVEGTHEVATPVTFGALTTIIAFIPLFYFEGKWGDYASQIPPIVSAVLLFSLVESKLVLPAHLKHLRPRPENSRSPQAYTAKSLEWFIARIYQPTLKIAVRNRGAVLALFAAMAMAMIGFCRGGHMGFVSFPTVDRQRISALIDLPDDTPLEVTEKYVQRMSDALDQMRTEYIDKGTGKSILGHTIRLSGSRVPGRDFDKSRGYMTVEVMAPDKRSEQGPRNSELAERWTELVGPIPEATSFRIYADNSLDKDNDYDDESLNVELRGPRSPEKFEVAEEIKRMLESQPGISTAWANVNYGQDELAIQLKPRAAELGLNQSTLANQIRQAFFGEEAQRMQRGVDDIRVMVRLEKEARESLHTLSAMKIRTPDGANVPLTTVADVSFSKAPSFIERNDRAEIIRCGGQPVDETVDVLGIAAEIQPRLDALCAKHNLSYQFMGYVAEAEKAQRQTIIGALLLFAALFAMLAVALRSLIQPIYVMLSVPFAIIGALLGHWWLELTPSYLSIFGMLALAGISVNDTLVLVDYINRRTAEGEPLKEAVLQAGGRRFRPIFLTSITTFAGLLPLTLDRSLQAQFLIPMAVSIAFGVVFATAITLYLVPCTVMAGDDIARGLAACRRWYLKPFRGNSPPPLQETT